MISHQHKCIFIHISKCAGSSIESAFGIDISDNTEKNNRNLFGWNSTRQFFLQHATPQELLDGNFITQEIWDSYFKFIIVRNPYSRALSDYLWVMQDLKIAGSFEEFLTMDAAFGKMKDKTEIANYRADHLTKQIDYFFINGDEIRYDFVLRFENLQGDLNAVSTQLGLPSGFFDKQINTSKKKYEHYSYFYSKAKRKLVENKYAADLQFLGYIFEDKSSIISIAKSFLKGNK